MSQYVIVRHGVILLASDGNGRESLALLPPCCIVTWTVPTDRICQVHMTHVTLQGALLDLTLNWIGLT